MNFITDFNTNEDKEEFLRTRIEYLNLPYQIEKVLKKTSILTLRGLTKITKEKFRDQYNLNEPDLDILVNKFNSLAVKTKDEYNKRDSKKVENKQEASTTNETINISGNAEKPIIDWVKNSKISSSLSLEEKIKLTLIEEKRNNFLKTRTEFLGFSTKLQNVLLNANIRTAGGIVRKKDSDLLKIKGFGQNGLKEVRSKVIAQFNKFSEEYHLLFKKEENRLSPEEEENLKKKNQKEKEELNNRIQIIEQKYSEKQKEKRFIHLTNIVSLGIDTKIETILLKNKIFTVGDFLENKIDNLKDKCFLDDEEIDSLLDIFDYLILKNTEIEKELENLRMQEYDLIGCLSYKLDKKNSYIIQENKKITTRDINIFILFRNGLTLEEIGRNNSVTRERARQIIKNTINKIGLDYKEEKLKILLKKNELKPKKVKKERFWSRDYKMCNSCNMTIFRHIRHGLCEKCIGGFKGETREKIILSHHNKCDSCNLSRDKAKINHGRDFYIRKDETVLCRKCFLHKTGKIIGINNKNKWKLFYK